MLALGIEHPQARVRIPEVIHKQFTTRQRQRLNRRIPFRNHLTPLVARGVLQIDGQDSPLGSFPVRMQVEPVTADFAFKPGWNVVHDRNDGPVVGDILHIDFRLVGCRTVINLNEQIAPVIGDGRADDFVRAVTLTEDLGVLRRVRPHGVIAHAGSLRGMQRVVEPAVVRLP